MSVVRCAQCGTVVPTRAELRVGGHGLRPFHVACYGAHAAERPWYRHPGWPINRWRSFVPFNALLLALIGVVHAFVEPVPAPRLAGALGLVLLANAWLLVGRLVSYRAYERHLPAGDGAARADTSRQPGR